MKKAMNALMSSHLDFGLKELIHAFIFTHTDYGSIFPPAFPQRTIKTPFNSKYDKQEYTIVQSNTIAFHLYVSF